MRRCWELTFDERLKRNLIAYNIEDCRAAGGGRQRRSPVFAVPVESSVEMKLEIVNVGSLAVGFQRTFGKFPSALPEFEKINAAAYWDYQRSKVYVRSSKAVRRSIKTSVEGRKKVPLDKEITVEDKPSACHKCGSSKVYPGKRGCKSSLTLNLRAEGSSDRL